MRYGMVAGVLLVSALCFLVSGCARKSAQEPGKKEAAEAPAKDKAEPEKQGAAQAPSEDKAEPEKEAAAELGIEERFAMSLHKSGGGMKYWYEKEDGFMSVTGIPYAKLDCSSCHVKGCEDCHTAGKPGEGEAFVASARKKETCMKCHTRAKLTFAKDGEENLDVHIAAGMDCADCHGDEDVHGDGKAHASMRDPGAVKAACTDCHTEDAEDAPALSMDIRGHKKHAQDLHCTACHVRNTLTCNNCHFDSFLAEKSRKGNFIPQKDSLYLVNHEGKVTAGTAMTLVHGQKGFVTYAPYFTHSIMSPGRTCNECHGLDIAVKMAAGEKIPMAWLEDGKPEFASGVIPVVPELLQWVYFDKKDGEWTAIEEAQEAPVHMTGHAEPLTRKQLRKLTRKKK